MNLLKIGALAALAVASSAAYSQFILCAGVGTGGGLRIPVYLTSGTYVQSFGDVILGSVEPENLVSVGTFKQGAQFQVIVKNGPKGDYYAWNLNLTNGARVSVVRIAASVPDGKYAGVGDFDGDGNSEFVIVNPLGKAFAYEIDKVTGLFSERLALGVATSGEFDKVVGTADVDGDNDSDLVLQSSTTNRICYRYYVGTARQGVSAPLTDGSAQVVAPAGNVIGASNLVGLELHIKSTTNGNFRVWKMTGTVRNSNDVATGWNPNWFLIIGKHS